MTTDERLDRLTERHEALTQSVELLTADLHKLQGIVKDLGAFTREIADGTARLLHVAQVHEQRLDHLEGDRPAH